MRHLLSAGRKEGGFIAEEGRLADPPPHREAFHWDWCLLTSPSTTCPLFPCIVQQSAAAVQMAGASQHSVSTSFPASLSPSGSSAGFR